MILKPCDQVHTFFMRFAIGVIFLDESGKVLDKQLLKPWQRSRKVERARAVVETGPEVFEQVGLGETLIIGAAL